MAEWKTYLIMYFGTNGTIGATEIAERLEELGFETTFGSVDFIYNWRDEKPTKEKILAIGDKVTEILKGSGAVFNLDTHD